MPHEEGVRVSYRNNGQTLEIKGAVILEDGTERVFEIVATKTGTVNFNCALRSTIQRHVESFLASGPVIFGIGQAMNEVNAEMAQQPAPTRYAGESLY